MKSPTNWTEAKEQTLELWRKIRHGLGRDHPIDLLAQINLICPLCEQAMAERGGDFQPGADKCAFCIAYHQLGGCREVCAEISTRVAEKDWEAARTLADDFIGRLERLEAPPEPGAVAPPL